MTKPNRGSDMDSALFEALQSDVPQKDTGPDPDDILIGLFEESAGGDSGKSVDQAGRRRKLVLELDEADRERAEQIIQMIRGQTGEQIEIAQAIKIALLACPMKEEEIERAFVSIRARMDSY